MSATCLYKECGCVDEIISAHTALYGCASGPSHNAGVGGRSAVLYWYCIFNDTAETLVSAAVPSDSQPTNKIQMGLC